MEINNYFPTEKWENLDAIYLQQGIPHQLIQLKNSDIYEQLRCQICNYLAYKPIACYGCRAVFCEVCITKHLTTDKKCPKCNKPFKNSHIDKQQEEFLNGLQIKCIFQNEGCKLSVPYETYESHIQRCGKRPRRCPICYAIVLQEEFERHYANCQQTEVSCNKCLKKLPYKKLEYHQSKCQGIDQKQSQKVILDKLVSMERKLQIAEQKISYLETKLKKNEYELKFTQEELFRQKVYNSMQNPQNTSNSNGQNVDISTLREMKNEMINNSELQVNYILEQSNLRRIIIPQNQECVRLQKKFENNITQFTLLEEEISQEKGLIGATFDISDPLPILSNVNYIIEIEAVKLSGLAIIGFRLDEQEMLNVSSNAEFYHYIRDSQDDSLWSGKLIGTVNFSFKQGDLIELLYFSSGMKFTLLNKTQSLRYTCDLRKHIDKTFQRVMVKIMASLSSKNDSLALF